MALIRFRVIRVKNNFVLGALAVAVAVVMTIILTPIGDKRILPTFGSMESRVSENKKLALDLGDGAVKKMLCLGLPYLTTFDDDRRAPILDFTSLVKQVSNFTTNIDIYSPKSYFSFQIPLMSLTKAQTTITPGIELLPEPISPIEDEHDPQGPFLDPPSPDIDEALVERIEQVGGKPLVLIFHTHTSESFMPSPAYNYKPRDKAYHTEELKFSVARVGDVLTQELLNLKIPTLHNKTIHDIPTYTTSYSNSLKTVEELLKENPSIQIVIDLHRDAPVVDSQKSREITTVKIEDSVYSRLMFVVGTDSTFPHPHWKENYQFALLLNTRLEQEYPGISRGIDMRKERFNQHLSKKALLIEFGSHGNTMEESLASAKIFAQILAEVIGELY